MDSVFAEESTRIAAVTVVAAVAVVCVGGCCLCARRNGLLGAKERTQRGHPRYRSDGNERRGRQRRSARVRRRDGGSRPPPLIIRTIHEEDHEPQEQPWISTSPGHVRDCSLAWEEECFLSRVGDVGCHGGGDGAEADAGNEVDAMFSPMEDGWNLGSSLRPPHCSFPGSMSARHTTFAECPAKLRTW